MPDAAFTLLKIKGRILRKLVRWKKWGASHTENVVSGLPSNLKGGKLVESALYELIQDEWLSASVKTGEIHYSLNPKKMEEILKFLEDYEAYNVSK